MFYQAFTAYCQAAGLAMQIQQEMLRPWVNLWLMAMAAAAGGERTEPIQTMQKRRLGDSEAFDTQGTSARTAEGARIEVREEELRAHKQLVEAGEVRVRKEVVTERRTLEVPVQREVVVIERRAPTGELVEELRIPVREEQVTVEKRPVVKEEVTVGKRVVEGTERVGGEVHKEMVRVEREGDVDVHGDGPGQGGPFS
ncbi:MAG: YsnF/AvaK domain-containing protein [Planctomycetaceae bacterium]|nr:YsnF/AvaK domain-containing protein [Planctomycetaceae bacterium]